MKITMNVWDKLSHKYDSLWVQKYSLTPSRNKILTLIYNKNNDFWLLDIGCATGQLLGEIGRKYPKANLLGIDKSQKMIQEARYKNVNIEFECAAAEEFNTDKQFDIITCCHSFPYYLDKPKVLETLASVLKDDGKAIFIQASINNFYDKLVLSVIEQTAEKADYFSRKDFCRLAEKYFVVEGHFTIQEKWFMPSICGFKLGKKV